MQFITRICRAAPAARAQQLNAWRYLVRNFPFTNIKASLFWISPEGLGFVTCNRSDIVYDQIVNEIQKLERDNPHAAIEMCMAAIHDITLEIVGVAYELNLAISRASVPQINMHSEASTYFGEMIVGLLGEAYRIADNNSIVFSIGETG